MHSPAKGRRDELFSPDARIEHRRRHRAEFQSGADHGLGFRQWRGQFRRHGNIQRHAGNPAAPALTLAGGIVYVAYAGYDDTDPYHGWIIGFNATNLVQLTNYVFNTTPNSTIAAYGANAGEGGIWMSGGGLSVDDSTNLYLRSRQRNFQRHEQFREHGIRRQLHQALDDQWPGRRGLFHALQPVLSAGRRFGSRFGRTFDSAGSIGNFPHLLLGAGNKELIYLINRDQMTTGNNHFDPTNSIDFVVQTVSGHINGCYDTPAYFNGQIYYAGNGDHLKAFAVTNGVLVRNPVSQTVQRTYGFPGATPSISANGTNNGIVWTLQMGTPAVLVAGNATNLTTELYNSSQASGNRDRLANGTKFAVPTVADGKVFVGNSNSVSVFGLLAGTFTFSSPAYSVAEANTNVTVTVNRAAGRTARCRCPMPPSRAARRWPV